MTIAGHEAPECVNQGICTQGPSGSKAPLCVNPSRQEEVPATQLAVLRRQEPQQDSFHAVANANSAEVDRSAVWATTGEKRNESIHDLS